MPSGCPEPVPNHAPGFIWVPVSATPLPLAEYRRQTTQTMERTPSRRDRRPLGALLGRWVLVSERGLEPPRGVKPHQVLSLTSLTFPVGAGATPRHSNPLCASRCNKVEILVLVQGALRVPRQRWHGTPLFGIRSVEALGIQPGVALPWSPGLSNSSPVKTDEYSTYTDSNQSQVSLKVSLPRPSIMPVMGG